MLAVPSAAVPGTGRRYCGAEPLPHPTTRHDTTQKTRRNGKQTVRWLVQREKGLLRFPTVVRWHTLDDRAWSVFTLALLSRFLAAIFRPYCAIGRSDDSLHPRHVLWDAHTFCLVPLIGKRRACSAPSRHKKKYTSTKFAACNTRGLRPRSVSSQSPDSLGAAPAIADPGTTYRRRNRAARWRYRHAIRWCLAPTGKPAVQMFRAIMHRAFVTGYRQLCLLQSHVLVTVGRRNQRASHRLSLSTSRLPALCQVPVSLAAHREGRYRGRCSL